MIKQISPWTILIALVMACVLQTVAGAQVIEERKGEANPSTVIFHATLYGAGTGLLLGGAYALVEKDEDLTTWEILKWGVAGGTAAGLLIGLIYVVARPEPHGDVEKVGRMVASGDRVVRRITGPTIVLNQRQGVLGAKHSELQLKLVNVAF